jgi:hypothetical protein
MRKNEQENSHAETIVRPVLLEGACLLENTCPIPKILIPEDKYNKEARFQNIGPNYLEVFFLVSNATLIPRGYHQTNLSFALEEEIQFLKLPFLYQGQPNKSKL